MKARTSALALGLAAFVLATTACSEDRSQPVGLDGGDGKTLASSHLADPVVFDPTTVTTNNPVPDAFWGEFWVCKAGTDATFDWEVRDADNTTVLDSGSELVLENNCELVGHSDVFETTKFAHVTEQVPEGWEVTDILVWSPINEDGSEPIWGFDAAHSLHGDDIPTPPFISGPFVEDSGNKDGCIVIFVNQRLPGGGQGCTPGYWKARPHLDSWDATGFDTDDSFAEVFADGDGGLQTAIEDLELANPENGTVDDLTLLEALNLRGGGVNALIRHAVAALLNASHPDVDYDLTAGQIFDAFAAAIDGGDVEGTKDTFADFNEQGCTLN